MVNSLKTYIWSNLRVEKKKNRTHRYANARSHCMAWNRLDDAGTHDSMMKCTRQVSLELVLTTVYLLKMTNMAVQWSQYMWWHGCCSWQCNDTSTHIEDSLDDYRPSWYGTNQVVPWNACFQGSQGMDDIPIPECLHWHCPEMVWYDWCLWCLNPPGPKCHSVYRHVPIHWKRERHNVWCPLPCHCWISHICIDGHMSGYYLSNKQT